MEFCSLVRCAVLDEDDLVAIDNAITNFHITQTIFEELGICPDGISLPQQHLLVHYHHLIQEFGAPNALGQMLMTNQRLDKLAASRIDFQAHGMLQGSLFDNNIVPPEPPPLKELTHKPVPHVPQNIHHLSMHLNLPHLPDLLSHFLYCQTHPNLDVAHEDIPLDQCPPISGQVCTFSSAIATFFAPSD
ncbi:hypothetical protein BYT27DRAFT_7253875 [Phlegmacium glaucopus]|nr:hypothetical protein BYT27DRAFT_7253875 [Phlegmacium glaucopus]